VSAAIQVYYASFDTAFFKLPSVLRVRIEAKIDEMGSRLASYPHHRSKGSNRFRARVGGLSNHLCVQLGEERDSSPCHWASARDLSALTFQFIGNCDELLKRRIQLSAFQLSAFARNSKLLPQKKVSTLR
jgi:hypothetical protein